MIVMLAGEWYLGLSIFGAVFSVPAVKSWLERRRERERVRARLFDLCR